MSLFSDEKPVLSSGTVIDNNLGYGVKVAGVTLTAGDLPLFQVKDSSGAVKIIVLTSGDALAVR